MLDEKGKRQLAYVVEVGEIKPIEGRDRVECAMVGGWTCMVPRGAFKEGDLGIFFEVDSKLPEKEPFMFLEQRHFKIKTQKYKTPNGQFWSQGLLMSAKDFGWELEQSEKGVKFINNKNKGELYGKGAFLTKELGVTYASADDNHRKSSNGSYQSMVARHKKLFNNKFIKWLGSKKFGRKILLLLFGRKSDGKKFPTKFPNVKVTDQERVENMTWVLNDTNPFFRTQKCDGSSATYIIERKPFGRYEFYVCSRNVRQLSPSQDCFHSGATESVNVYWEMANKYDIKNKLIKYLNDNHLDYVAIQGEICGPGIQKNPHHLKNTHLFLFHMMDNITQKYNILRAQHIWNEMNFECVPIEPEQYFLPKNFEQFKMSADGFYDPSVCEGQTICPREGFVYYSVDDPTFSFKNVSRPYLLNHNN